MVPRVTVVTLVEGISAAFASVLLALELHAVRLKAADRESPAARIETVCFRISETHLFNMEWPFKQMVCAESFLMGDTPVEFPRPQSIRVTLQHQECIEKLPVRRRLGEGGKKTRSDLPSPEDA